MAKSLSVIGVCLASNHAPVFEKVTFRFGVGIFGSDLSIKPDEYKSTNAKIEQ